MSCTSCSSSAGSQAQQLSVQSQIQMTVFGKQLEAMRQQGKAVTTLLEGAVQLSQEQGKGESFDAQV